MLSNRFISVISVASLFFAFNAQSLEIKKGGQLMRGFSSPKSKSKSAKPEAPRESDELKSLKTEQEKLLADLDGVNAKISVICEKYGERKTNPSRCEGYDKEKQSYVGRLNELDKKLNEAKKEQNQKESEYSKKLALSDGNELDVDKITCCGDGTNDDSQSCKAALAESGKDSFDLESKTTRRSIKCEGTAYCEYNSDKFTLPFETQVDCSFKKDQGDCSNPKLCLLQNRRFKNGRDLQETLRKTKSTVKDPIVNGASSAK